MRRMKVLHLVPASVSDFVRKDMEYSERHGPIETSVMKIGWSGRRHFGLSFVSLVRMLISSLKVWKLQPDVVHAHFLRSALTAAVSRRPAVLTMHNSHDELPNFWRILLKIAARWCSVIYVSNYNRECWAPILNKQGTVVYHAIDTAGYNPEGNTDEVRSSYLDKLGTSCFVVSMGAMTPVRGLHLVVFAAAEVRRKGIDLGVVLKGYGGDPQYTKRVKKLAERLDVPTLIITSFISDEDMASMIASADVFVRPTSVESFGIAVLEAQACGTPAIVNDCCSLKEVFRDSSLRFKLRDSKDLAEKIMEILTDESLRKNLIDAGLENARKLSWEKKIKSYLKVYMAARSGLRP